MSIDVIGKLFTGKFVECLVLNFSPVVDPVDKISILVGLFVDCP